MDAESEDENEEEHPVVAEAGEDIEVTLTKLARVDLVEKLHENEGLEDDGVNDNLWASFELDNWTWRKIGILIALPWSSAFSAGSSDVIFIIVEVVTLLKFNVEERSTAEEED